MLLIFSKYKDLSIGMETKFMSIFEKKLNARKNDELLNDKR